MNSTQIKKATGARLKALRKYYEMSQEDLASYLDMTQSGLNHYESGRSMISPEAVFTLTANYQITSDWLYFGIEKGMDEGLVRDLNTILKGEDWEFDFDKYQNTPVVRYNLSTRAIGSYAFQMIKDLRSLHRDEFLGLFRSLLDEDGVGDDIRKIVTEE